MNARSKRVCPQLTSGIAQLGLTEEQIKALFNDPTSINKPDFDLGDDAKRAIVQGYAQGFQKVFLMAAGLCAFSSLVSLIVSIAVNLRVCKFFV